MRYLALHLGPMFSGKTSHLNQLASQTLAVGHTVELWLPPLSEEGSLNAQKSKEVSLLPRGVHVRYLTNEQLNASTLSTFHQMPNSSIDLVLIDETHFFDDQVLFDLMTKPLPSTHPYANSHFHCFGLNGTYQLTPWPTISRLIPLASKIRHYRAKCSRCGHKVKAGFSHLKATSNPENPNAIKIEGGSDLYEALCYRCMTQSLQHPTTT